jgi:hypothetical protein
MAGSIRVGIDSLRVKSLERVPKKIADRGISLRNESQIPSPPLFALAQAVYRAFRAGINFWNAAFRFVKSLEIFGETHWQDPLRETRRGGGDPDPGSDVFESWLTLA